ncbi:MAG: glycerol-3-phosphate 1-O-acyltransferase PlsY [Bacillota bacterium]|jgi:glycerol-3-phosphate acyltransferase PlsY
METVLAIVASYLIGSIPVGHLMARAMGVKDLRRHGSGNIGATNVWRTLGPGPGLLVYAGDTAKGFMAVLIGRELGTVNTEVLAATAALVGHGWPVFLRFQGGKVIATGSGVVLALSPLVFGACVLLWLTTLGLGRWVSLASMVTASFVPLGLLFTGSPWQYTAFGVGVALLAVYKHRSNITRILNGTEPKVRSGRR